MTNLVPVSAESSIKRTNPVRRFVTDVFTGLGLFALGTLMTSGSGALAATLTLDGGASGIMEPASAAQPVLLLALVFSLLFALNASFFRHLSKVYARAGR